MRDFRDAKAMARTLRASLAAKGLKITISQSLELIAEVFGVGDWNTLAAAIRPEAASPPPTAERPPESRPTLLSRELELTLHRALSDANHREHDDATLEHLLLALIDDPDASAVMKACNVDLGVLKRNLDSHIDTEPSGSVNRHGGDSQPSSAFQRVLNVAVIHVQSPGGGEVTGANVLVALFAERESRAVYFLQEQDMTRYDAVSYISHGIVKGSETRKRSVEQGNVRQSFSHGRTKPVVVEKVKRRTAAPRDGQTAKAPRRTPPK
jgi:ATP-dependent Clp protease ATP-binding subunit ClpA